MNFTDRNNQKISSVDVVTNEFGSFAGTFVAPANVLTGRMNLRAEGVVNGSSSVRVEEYKRPKFYRYC